MRLMLCCLFATALLAADPLQIVATVPELGSIARSVGGEDVAVTVLAQPGEDPHHVEAKPSFVVALSRADLVVQTGLDLEADWLPQLIASSGNPRIAPPAAGEKPKLAVLDTGALVAAPIGVPTGPVDPTADDVHAHGNPHCLFDPQVGLAVADELARRLSTLRPEAAERVERRRAAFAARLGEALFGTALAGRFDPAKLLLLADRGRLDEFLAQQGASGQLGGWLALLPPGAGAAVAADHDLYVYFARRFGLRVVAVLEPRPGVKPSPRHLAEQAERMRAAGVKAILATPYIDRSEIALVASASGCAVVPMAHQAGALPGTDDYVDWIGANVKAVAAALASH